MAHGRISVVATNRGSTLLQVHIGFSVTTSTSSELVFFFLREFFKAIVISPCVFLTDHMVQLTFSNCV